MGRTDTIQFLVADESHEIGIRALLCERAMAGRVELSFRREPGYFASVRREYPESLTIVAVEDERVVCVGSVGIRDRYVNGTPVRVGYLAQLRLANSHAGRVDVLRRGYAFFRKESQHLGVVLYFTSIASDNMRARQLFEHNPRGFPTYTPIGQVITLVIPVRRLLRARARLDPDVTTVCTTPLTIADFNRLLDAHNAHYQCAPRWLSPATQEERGCETNLQLIGRGESIVGGAAMWEQRAFKQTVVAGYSGRLQRVRLLHNLFAQVTGGVVLPPAGSVLPNAFVSHLATTAEYPEDVVPIMVAIARYASERAVELLTVGFDARDPRCELLRRRFRPHTYCTNLYRVNWLNDGSEPTLDGRLMYPEVALL